MLLREILKLRSSEVAGNVYFSIHFCISKLSRRATKLHEKKCTLSESLKCGGHVPLVPPRFLRPWLHDCMLCHHVVKRVLKMPFRTSMHPVKRELLQENASVGKLKPRSAVVAWQGPGGRSLPQRTLGRALEK